MSTFDIDIEKAKRQSARLLPEYGVGEPSNEHEPESTQEQPDAATPGPDIELLPIDARMYAYDVAKRMDHAPLSFAMTAALLTLSTAMGRRVAVRPKLKDIWEVIPNLWGMLVAPPSVKKTPILAEMVKPLKLLEMEANERYEEEMKRYNAEKIAYEIELKEYKAKLKEGETPPIPDEPDKPIRSRYLIDDATTEKVAEIMIENPKGIGLFMDELSGWFKSMGKQGREGDRSFWLESFNGNGSKSVDRIGRGSLLVPHMCATIFGTIQPDALMGIVSGATGATSGGDGLLQRFQLISYEDRVQPVYTDELPDTIAREAYYDLVRKIALADPVERGAKKDRFSDTPFYRFSPEAVEISKAFFGDINEELKVNEEHNPAYAAHLGKFHGLMPSLALILFYADRVSGHIDEEMIPASYAERARKLCDFYKRQAMKVYDLERLKERKLEALDEKIVEKVKEIASAGKLPISFGKLSQMVKGAKAKDCERALKGVAIRKGRKIVSLLPASNV
ncbi:YfjI family protein [Hydrogenimonas sp.]